MGSERGVRPPAWHLPTQLHGGLRSPFEGDLQRPVPAARALLGAVDPIIPRVRAASPQVIFSWEILPIILLMQTQPEVLLSLLG